jgi:glycyl-tRNA synthetase beta chain
MSDELLLELLSEEIPARMQRRAIEDLTALLRDKLAGAGLPAVELKGHVTPRRLAVIADGIPARQPDRSEERRGPRVGAPQQALDGFLRAAGLTSIDQCEQRETERGAFYFATIKQPGRATAEVLPDLIYAAVNSLSWPKSMRFPASSMRWVRPLNSVICLFDSKVVPLPLDNVPVGRVTRGHRFLSTGEISVTDAADYLAKLEAAHVVLDQDRRRKIIDADLRGKAATAGLKLKDDPGLLDEVTGLVEYPVVLMGMIDADFVRPLPEGLPPEVLATAMRTHQKYFTCLNPDGTPAPRFLFVANNVTPDGGKTIAAGNERVLRARLSDARFFWDQDRKVTLESRVEALKQRVFHEKLGSVYDKVRRSESLIEYLAEKVPQASASIAREALLLAKSDLSSGVVGEFPELQGVMGCYYSLQAGKEPRIAQAIADHYKPLGPNDSCPTAPISVVVALADKIDSLAALFAANERPTGSRDPFALRRSALGIIRLIIENEIRLNLKRPLTTIAGYFDVDFQKFPQEVLDFIIERLVIHLRDKGVRHDLINAVVGNPEDRMVKSFLGISKSEDDLVRLLARVDALRKFLASDDGINLLIAYRRAANIVAIEEKRHGRQYDGSVDPPLPKAPQAEELALAANLRLSASGVDRSLASEEFEAAMGHLASMRRHIDEFFDKVTVNVDNAVLRENRLRLLSRIRAVMNQVADFSQIEG